MSARWYAGKAVKMVDVLEQHEAEHRANARDGVPQRQGVGIGVRGGCEERELQVFEPLSIRGDESQVDLDGLWPRRFGNSFGPPSRLALSAICLPIAGRLDWLLVLCTWAKRSARVHLRWGRRLSRARVARMAAGETEACGSIPPRSTAAIFCESLVSFLAFPP